MLGVLIGLTLCISIWRISSQEPLIIAEYSPYTFPSGAAAAGLAPGAAINVTTQSPPVTIEQLPIHDFNTLIDLDNFDFIINQKSCANQTGGTPPPDVLILIHSAPLNWNKRNVIRETWGREDSRSRVIFMLGTVNSTRLQHRLEQENYMFGDIVQGNFVDAYRNMTYKHVMALKWLSYYCPEAKYLLKADDDVFVHTPNLYEYLQDPTTHNRNFLFCSRLENARVSRSYRSKWRVHMDEYPGRYYPTYCPGFSIVYSTDTAFTLYKEAQRMPYFWIDDVHITGTLATSAQINITPLGTYYLGKSQRERIFRGYDEASVLFIFTSPNLTEKEIRTLWKLVSSAWSTTSYPPTYR